MTPEENLKRYLDKLEKMERISHNLFKLAQSGIHLPITMKGDIFCIKEQIKNFRRDFLSREMSNEQIRNFSHEFFLGETPNEPSS